MIISELRKLYKDIEEKTKNGLPTTISFKVNGITRVGHFIENVKYEIVVEDDEKFNRVTIELR